MSSFSPISDNQALTGCGVDTLTDSFYSTADRVRKALKQDMAECRLSREEVAIRLSVRMGRIGVAILDAYVAESKPHKFAADFGRIVRGGGVIHRDRRGPGFCGIGPGTSEGAEVNGEVGGEGLSML